MTGLYCMGSSMYGEGSSELEHARWLPHGSVVLEGWLEGWATPFPMAFPFDLFGVVCPLTLQLRIPKNAEVGTARPLPG